MLLAQDLDGLRLLRTHWMVNMNIIDAHCAKSKGSALSRNPEHSQLSWFLRAPRFAFDQTGTHFAGLCSHTNTKPEGTMCPDIILWYTQLITVTTIRMGQIWRTITPRALTLTVLFKS
jgi:hypothetical protein